MIDVPAIIPVTSPVDGLIVATDVLELVHVPPPVTLLRDVVRPTHTEFAPVIGSGVAFTVTVVNTSHMAPVPLE